VKAKYIVGAVIIIAFAVWGVSSFLTTTIKYVSIEDVPATDRTIQVMGAIDFDTVEFDTDNSRLIFDITDPDDRNAVNRLRIVYTGIVPGNFDQATSVVVKGRYRDGALIADQLYVKCPSKYQGLEEEA
jgi:cytochrome c-type biogenesis protein CcmE